MPPAGVLTSRLAPPRLPSGHLPRELLRDLVLGGLDARLVTVVAGAGYGKSTLLAEVVADLGRPHVWVTLDERMRSPRSLAAHVVAGFAGRFPGFGAALALQGTPADLAEELAGEIGEIVGEDVVLVLDDVHAVSPSADAVALVGALVRDLPWHVHLLLASRAELGIPLARLRASGELVEISEEDLVLEVGECEELLRRAGFPLEPDALRDLHLRTEGWVAGLLMGARERVSRGSRRPIRGEGALFDYLAEEAVADQPPEVREFLLATSVFERFSPRLADLATRRSDAAATIARLMDEHLFTVRLEGEVDCYRYHALFSSFLRARAGREGAPALAERHRRAAEAWRSVGEPLEAVRHLIDAGDARAVVDLLEPIADALVTSDDAPALAAWLQRIPRPLWEHRPALALAEASLLFGEGDYAASCDALDAAIERLLVAGEDLGAVSACFRLMGAAEMAGAVEWGISAAQRHLPRVGPGAPLLAEARVRLAGLHGYRARVDAGERELAEAERLGGSALLPAYVEVTRGFYLERCAGDPALALQQVRAGLDRIAADEGADVLAFEPWVHSFVGVLLEDLGRYDELLDRIDRYGEALRRRGLAGAGQWCEAWLRFGALAGLERWAELEAELARSRALFETPGGFRGWDWREPLARARLASHRGDREGTAGAIASARERLREFGFAFETAMTLCGLAPAAAAVGLDGVGLVEEAAEAARAADSTWAMTRAAMVHASLDDGGAGDRRLAQALALSGGGGCDPLWARKERRLAGPLLARALARGIGPASAAERILEACDGAVVAACLEHIGPAPASVRARLAESAAAAQGIVPAAFDSLAADGEPLVRRVAERSRAVLRDRPRPPLALTTLGAFAVARDGVAMAGSELGRPRVRALLAALLAAGGAADRDVLCEWLWPGLPAPRALRSLQVTVSELRRALDPERERPRPDALLVADGDRYLLALGRRDDWDARRFLALSGPDLPAETAAARLARLREAEALYRGPFLPDHAYADWSAEPRRELEERHREVLERIARALLAGGDPTEAADRLRRLVTAEPEVERHHRGLMTAWAAMGETALALRQFHACRALLRQRLGVEPSPETRELYRSLL